MTDKRAQHRQRVLKAAKIALSNGGMIDCTIRDISEDGACLRVASTLGIPDFFDLVFDHKTRRPCRLAWRKETQIGVTFQLTIAGATGANRNSFAVWGSTMDTSIPVLVVDDSITMTHIISDLVRNIGFTDIDIAHDGLSALDRMRQKKYGLLISDWEMQSMNGDELFKRMRSDKTIGNIPIIVITATAGRGTSWLAGAAAYLRKPFNEIDFRTAVKRVLEPPRK